MKIIEYENVAEEIIKDWMGKLKPELKKGVVWQLSDEIKKGKEGIIRADINKNFNPSVITFYIHSIAYSHLCHAIEDIKQIIRHEIAHLFLKGEENVSSKEKNWNIFTEK